MVEAFGETVEQLRQHMGFTQRRMASLLGMPVRTYEEKRKHGFREVDRMAACWVYLKWAGGAEPRDARLDAEFAEPSA